MYVRRNDRQTGEKTSVYVPIYNKGDMNEYGNYCTIAVISHVSNVPLRVLLKKSVSWHKNHRSSKLVSEEEGEREITLPTLDG